MKEKLHGVDIDDIGNLKDLPRLECGEFYKECGNLKVFFDSGELTRNISKRRSQRSAYRFLLFDKCHRLEYFFIWNIVNQLGMVFIVGW